MAETIEILRKRWREVAVIIILWLFLSMAVGPKLGRNASGILSALVFLLGIIGLVVGCILQFGFLRTAYLSHSKRQKLWNLLKEGKRFFWRMFHFYAAFGLALFLYVFVIFKITDLIAGGKLSFWALPLWIRNLYFLSGLVILIKIALLTPAIIIVHDCKLRKAVGVLSKYKLLKAKETLFIFVISSICNFASAVLWPYIAGKVQYEWLAGTAHGILSWFLQTAMYLSAVLFVASANTVHVMLDDLKEADGKAQESNSNGTLERN